MDLNYLKWPTVYMDNRDDVFEKRKKAVELYIDQNLTVSEIEQQTGIRRKEINSLLKRCISKDSKGRIWGYRALLRYKRLGMTYDRLSMTDGFEEDLKLTGAFMQLLQKYPKLNEFIKDYIYNRRKRAAADKIIRIIDLREKFLKLCRSLGIELNQYPFNTKNKALRSLERYVDKLTKENPERSSIRLGEDAGRILKHMDGTESEKELVVVPFECVQFDGHKMDALLTVKFKNAYGDDVFETMKRIWLLVIIDEATRAVLGKHLCLHSEYAHADVLHCIKNAVVPWEPMQFTIPGLAYPDKTCFHSTIPEAKWAVWRELKYDNAKANLAGMVQNRLTEVINCAVNPGPVKYPEARSIIERFFGLLEQNSIQRLSITTGSNPKDPRRNNPEKAAKQFEVTEDELSQFIEIAIAEYNIKIHSTFGLSPMEVMEQRIKFRDMAPRLLEEEKRSEIQFFSYKTTRTVRGAKIKGKRPHINYEGSEYTSTLVARNFGLVGSDIIIEVNIDDISVVKAYLSDGSELDYLRAKGPWSKSPHSLKTRKAINKLVREDKLKFDNTDCAIEIFSNYLEEKAGTSKSARNQLAAQQKYNQQAVNKPKEVYTQDTGESEMTPSHSVGEKESKKRDLEKLRQKLKTSC
jgi:putative transposase